MSLSLLTWRRAVAAAYAAARDATDPRAGWVTWRRHRDALFRDHPDSPLPPSARAGFAGLPYAEYDPALRFIAALSAAEPDRIEVPTPTDGTVPFDRVGRVELPDLGTLDVWWLGSYGGGLFVPVKDVSAGTTTYGGGRYLIDTVKGADLGSAGTDLVIDLNFAYHPSCAYDPAWACPLAPPGNVLAAPVTAGEQLPAGGWY
ncbi:MAG: DUF1684 domain-containing protein [Actinomycetota bacterium]|nr:DUF1684 domain-containing protein [Actinomycetota bacterium]